MSNDLDITIIQGTQKALGKYVKKPPLADKLLGKPPFRFLHDLTSSIIKETGFLKGLYTERELVSDNIKEKEDKLVFLNKLITAVKTITGKDLTVRASKVAAGLEPKETNLLLQAIGYALDNKLDSTQYVNQLKKKSEKPTKTRDPASKKTEKKEKNNKVEKVITTSTSDEKSRLKKTSSKISQSKNSKNIRSNSKDSQESVKKEKTKPKETPKKNSDRQFESPKQKISPNQKISPKIKIEEQIIPPVVLNEEKFDKNNEINDEKEVQLSPVEKKQDDTEAETKDEIVEEKVTIVSVPEILVQDAPITERVKSAKPKLPLESFETSENLKTKENSRLKSVKPKEKVIKTENELVSSLGGTTSNLEEFYEKPLVRPRSSLRPPSVRPSSARPGAPRVRSEIFIPEGEVVSMGKVNVILENFTKEQDEEETVTIQSITEPELQQTSIMSLPNDKGHLVEQILEQIQHDDNMIEHTRHNVDIEWEQDGLRTRNAATKEIEQLKTAIQTLTKTANPLGKLINYLHEDIEAMHSELETWTNITRQTMVDVATQKRISDESNKPLQTQLQQIEENILKHQNQINSIYGSILRNEVRIRDLLIK